MERYFSEPDCFHRLPEDKIDQLFLLESERRVSIDCVVTVEHIEYEVDYRFAKQRVRLRYSPDMESIYVAEADGTLTPTHLLNKIKNADIKREKPRLYGGDDQGWYSPLWFGIKTESKKIEYTTLSYTL